MFVSNDGEQVREYGPARPGVRKDERGRAGPTEVMIAVLKFSLC